MWIEFDATGNVKTSGHIRQNDRQIEVPEPPGAGYRYDLAGAAWVPDIAGQQALAFAAIDVAAEAARLRQITGGAGQAMTYEQKAAQAQAFKAANYAGTVPGLVQARATAVGISAQAAADQILGTRDAWLAKAAQIETARESGKYQVGQAANLAAVAAARDAALAALDAIHP